MAFMEVEKEREITDLLIDCVICYWKKDISHLLEDWKYYNQLEKNGL